MSIDSCSSGILECQLVLGKSSSPWSPPKQPLTMHQLVFELFWDMAIKECAVISSFSTRRLLNSFCRIIKNVFPFWSGVYFLNSFSISSTWLCPRPNSHEHCIRYNLDIFIPVALSINLRFWCMVYTHWVPICSFLRL